MLSPPPGDRSFLLPPVQAEVFPPSGKQPYRRPPPFSDIFLQILQKPLQNGLERRKVSTIAVGVQTADAGEGKQHVRLVGGLNVNYEDVTALTFTITDGVNNTTIVVKNVFGTLTANNAYGEITEITAASLGFESLFALTITNIPAGTTLNVTATYTTASGTYTSAVKTVEVPAAQ